jgi:tetratricopeptide (TPR) repeat protein
VEQAETLTLDAVQHDTAAGANPSAKQAATAASMKETLQNFAGAEVLAQETPWRMNSSMSVTLLALPPVVVLLIGLSRTRNMLAFLSGLLGSTVSRARRAVAGAQDSNEVAVAIRQFLARQCGLNEKSCDDEQVVGAIRVAGYRNLAVRCEQLLSLCASGSAGLLFDSSSTLEALKKMATQWLADWESERRKQRLKPHARSLKVLRKSGKSAVAGSPVSTIIAAIVVAASLFGAGQVASAETVKLNAQQQETLLAEANDAYKAALDKAGRDAAEAKQGFADAAGKYQMLVDGGVTNSRLYFNLGNAYLEGGDAGKAIANYLRCLRIDPTMRVAQTNLALARSHVETKGEAKDAGSQNVSTAKYLAIGNKWLNGRVSPHAVFVVMVVSWALLWMAVALRLCGVHLPWKMAATFASIVFAIAGASTFISTMAAERKVAVVVAAPAATGAGADSSAKVKTGDVVEIVQKRGDSTRIRTEDGATAWLPSEAVEAI